MNDNCIGYSNIIDFLFYGIISKFFFNHFEHFESQQNHILSDMEINHKQIFIIIIIIYIINKYLYKNVSNSIVNTK